MQRTIIVHLQVQAANSVPMRTQKKDKSTFSTAASRIESKPIDTNLEVDTKTFDLVHSVHTAADLHRVAALVRLYVEERIWPTMSLLVQEGADI